MSNSNVRTCGTCMYWARNEGAVLGECRRNPPHVVSDESESFPSPFPETYDVSWCGEWAEGRHLMTANERAIAGSVDDGASSDS